MMMHGNKGDMHHSMMMHGNKEAMHHSMMMHGHNRPMHHSLDLALLCFVGTLGPFVSAGLDVPKCSRSEHCFD
jgi:hypothetical protein